MKKISVLIGLLILLVSPSLKSQQVNNEEEANRIAAKVFYEFVKDVNCGSEEECLNKKFAVVRQIPNVEFTDYDTEDGKDYVFLMITNKKITNKKLITNLINKSGLIKVTNVVMPVPVDKTPYKDPYEGMTKEQIRKVYDDYYKENPELKPDNW